jgi:putative membrane protein
VKPLLARIIVLGVSFLIVDAVMETVTVSGGFFGALGLAILYGLVSAVIGTLLRLLTLPLILITVGLFEFVINAILLLATDALTDWLEIDGFVSAMGAAVVLTLASVGIGLLVALLVPGTRED